MTPASSLGWTISAGTRDQITSLLWIIEKAREFQKNIYFCFIDYTKPFDCVDQNKLWKILRGENTRLLYLPPEKPIKNQQLELDMEQQTGSKQEKEYVKAVNCYPAYLTSMQNTS